MATLVPMADGRTASPPVPWRTIFATVAVVVGTIGAFLLLMELSRIIAWLVVAVFFTVVVGYYASVALGYT